MHTWTTSATGPSAWVRSLESYLTSRGMPEPASGLPASEGSSATQTLQDKLVVQRTIGEGRAAAFCCAGDIHLDADVIGDGTVRQLHRR